MGAEIELVDMPHREICQGLAWGCAEVPFQISELFYTGKPVGI
ncbi:MAG: hypothetical protein ACXWRZ_11620 [Bdellovibrio sp.]